MKLFLLTTELGLVLLDEKNHSVSKLEFSEAERARKFLDASSGTLEDRSLEWLRENVKGEDVVFAEPQLVRSLNASGLKSEATTDDQLKEFTRTKVALIAGAGLASTAEEA